MPHAEHPPRYTELDLPQWRYLPGRVAAADSARLEPVLATVDQGGDPQTVQKLTAFLFGVDLYNAGFFWEAHEVWEPVWMSLPPNSRERIACQALIQAANGCLKLGIGRSAAFAKLAAEVARLVRDAASQGGLVAGIALDRWAAGFLDFAAAVAAAGVPAAGFDPTAAEGFPFITIDAGG